MTAAVLAFSPSAGAAAQEQQAPSSRAALIEQEQAAKAEQLTPQGPQKGEAVVNRVLNSVSGETALRFHPFFQSAYSGGGFTLGAGYKQFVSPYNTLDVRGSYTIRDYKRLEAEFTAPHLFKRRGALSVLGGWREATQVGFYGIGPDTPNDAPTNYQFEQPYVSALLEVKPTRQYLTLDGGVEYTRWSQGPGTGSNPSVETVYTPATLPGLGAEVTYLHTQGTVGFDWRTSPGYSRRGGYYGVRVHDYADSDSRYGFNQVDWEAIQHVPILREAWVLSFHALARTTSDKDDQQIPFFMLPAVGGGSSLRGYSSWRFRDRNSLLLQAEWRIMVNRYLDTAFFYDAGKVAARSSDLDFNHLKDDFGFGVRFHGPFSTALRLEIAKSREGMHYIFAAGPVF